MGRIPSHGNDFIFMSGKKNPATDPAVAAGGCRLLSRLDDDEAVLDARRIHRHRAFGSSRQRPLRRLKCCL
jgi:hypothetical protein